MELDRRGFLRLAGSTALLRAAAARGSAHAAAVPAIHERTRNTALGALGRRQRRPQEAGPWKPYPGAERLALPPPELAATRPLAQVLRDYAPTTGFAEQPLSPAALGRLLYLANGVTGRSGRIWLRAAPSAGALYAGELYVVVERVRGVDPGVYYYEVAENRLCRIRSGSLLDRVAQAHEDPTALGSAAAVVVLTNFFRRYTARYRNRGYRYALIDSGHIGENLRLAARAAELGEMAPLRFHDDALASLLEIDGREEAVCAVHAVGLPGEGSGTGVPRRFAERQWTDPKALEAVSPLTLRYHEATKLVPAASTTPPAAIPPWVTPAGGLAAALARGHGPQVSVEEAIRKRRSTSRFESEPIGLADLTFLLESARGHVALERAPGVDLYLVAHRVNGARPGLYRYEPEGHQLTGLREGDLRPAIRDACLGQNKAAEAAAVAIMAARFEPSPGALGTRLYRDQLLEAGAMAQRIYLAAEALGLTARNLAAFVDDDLNAFLGLDPTRAGAIHVTIFGRGD